MPPSKKFSFTIDKKVVISGILITVLGAVALGILSWGREKVTETIEDTQKRHQQVWKNKRDIDRIKRKLRMQ